MSKCFGKGELADWIIEKSEHLNIHWQNIMEAEQGGFRPNGSYLQSDRIQGITAQARSDIQEFRTEIANFEIPNKLSVIKAKYATYLDNWDNFFRYMAKYDTSGDLDDLGAATKSYKAVDVDLSEILQQLGLKPKHAQAHAYPQAQGPPTVSLHQVKEKGIVREKEVIIKVRCPYCQTFYDETLNQCPHCGAKR